MIRKRRTKIIATLGPATTQPQDLKNLLAAGVDLVRINFSHGTPADRLALIQLTRQMAAELQKDVSIIGDLQGPKIRISKFKNKSVELSVGAKFILDAALDVNSGDETHVGIDYKSLPQDVKIGDILLLDDGRIEMVVKAVQGTEIHCQVKVGGKLSNNKGINRFGGGLSAEALTEKDIEDIKFAVGADIDYLAVSFPRSAADIEQARRLVQEAGGQMGIIAKIERAEALDVIDEIIRASDAVMVARGDLGVEIGVAEVPGMQKHIIGRARALDRAVITATQMMESMITQSMPTRAEVSDVANAILDGTDAVMLSAETAVGDYPQQVVKIMAELCLSAEKHPSTQTSRHRVELQFQSIEESIAMAAMYVANHLSIKAIVALTETGATPLLMSRIRSGIPIYGLSRHLLARRRMALYRGVYPIEFDPTQFSLADVEQQVMLKLLHLGMVDTGDRLILTKGDFMGTKGGTNMLKILTVA